MRLFIACLAFFIASCANVTSPHNPPDYKKSYDLGIEDLPGATPEDVRIIYGDAERIPMVRLLSNPGAYDGKSVRIFGVLRHDFEATAIYLDKESYDYGIVTNAIFITTNYTDDSLLQKMKGEYIEITGIYENEPASMRLNYNGHIHDVAPMTPANIKHPDRCSSEPPYTEPEYREQTGS